MDKLDSHKINDKLAIKKLIGKSNIFFELDCTIRFLEQKNASIHMN